KTNTSSPTPRSRMPSRRFPSNTSHARGPPSNPCFGASPVSTSSDSTTPIGLTSYVVPTTPHLLIGASRLGQRSSSTLLPRARTGPAQRADHPGGPDRRAGARGRLFAARPHCPVHADRRPRNPRQHHRRPAPGPGGTPDRLPLGGVRC